MASHNVLLDAFADARRTWDELVGLQPDVVAGSGNLKEAALVELERRVEAHQASVDALVDAIETEPGETGERARVRGGRQGGGVGISNRETPAEEAVERRHFPPAETGPLPAEDAAGRVGEQPLEDNRDRHTAHKAGSRSIAQKESESRYPDRSMPATHKVAGAFGREPGGPSNRDQ